MRQIVVVSEQRCRRFTTENPERILSILLLRELQAGPL